MNGTSGYRMSTQFQINEKKFGTGRGRSKRMKAKWQRNGRGKGNDEQSSEGVRMARVLKMKELSRVNAKGQNNWHMVSV